MFETSLVVWLEMGGEGSIELGKDP